MLRSELALEEGRPKDAYEDVERALAEAAGTDDESATPEICALGIRALADQLAEARLQRRRFDEDKARLLAAQLMEEAQLLVDAPRQPAAKLCRRPKPSLCSARPKPHAWRGLTTALGSILR